MKKARRTRRQRTELKVGEQCETFHQDVWMSGVVSRVSGYGAVIDVRLDSGALLREMHSRHVRAISTFRA